MYIYIYNTIKYISLHLYIYIYIIIPYITQYPNIPTHTRRESKVAIGNKLEIEVWKITYKSCIFQQAMFDYRTVSQ